MGSVKIYLEDRVDRIARFLDDFFHLRRSFELYHDRQGRGGGQVLLQLFGNIRGGDGRQDVGRSINCEEGDVGRVKLLAPAGQRLHLSDSLLQDVTGKDQACHLQL